MGIVADRDRLGAVSHGDLRLLFPLRLLLLPDVAGLYLHHPSSVACASRAEQKGCRCRGSLASVHAGALPSLPTGGRGARHLGDIDGSLPVCCDADPGAEKSFTILEGDTEFLRVILGWAHIINDSYGPDALDEHVVSGDDGSSGYSHHDYCFYLFPVIWLLVEGASLGFVFAGGTICGRDSVPSFVSCGASFWV